MDSPLWGSFAGNMLLEYSVFKVHSFLNPEGGHAIEGFMPPDVRHIVRMCLVSHAAGPSNAALSQALISRLFRPFSKL